LTTDVGVFVGLAETLLFAGTLVLFEAVGGLFTLSVLTTSGSVLLEQPGKIIEIKIRIAANII